MKSNPVLLLLLSLATLAVGCKPTAETSTVESRDATTAQIDKLKKETKEAVQDINDYAYTQKSEFVDKMQIQLAEINKDLDQISDKVEKSSDADKAQVTPKLHALREQAPS